MRAKTRVNDRALQTLDAAVLAEIEKARAEGHVPRIDSRCHVCCEVESRDIVNSLLAAGLTNREIVDCCEAINDRRREKADKRIIGAQNVYVHRRDHFNVDKPAMAVYRHIMERRAEEANLDYINGIGHAITPYAVMETVMVKGYTRALKEETEVTTAEAMSAAKSLHEWTRSDASHQKMADLLFQMDRIIQAAQRFIPAHQHEAFLAAVEGREAVTPMAALAEKAQATIRQFAPSTVIDEEDQI